MNKIRWKKSNKNGTPNYSAKIGNFDLICRQTIIYKRQTKGGRSKTYEWYCTVYFDDKWMIDTKLLKSLESAKKDGEKLLTTYLFGAGFVMLRTLKQTGLLTEVLSEVGVDL